MYEQLLKDLQPAVSNESFQLEWATIDSATGTQFHELSISATDLQDAEHKLLGIKDQAKNTFLMGQVLSNDGYVLSNVA